MDVLTETPKRFSGPTGVTPLSTGALQQQIEQIERDAEEGHTRLRKDFRDLEAHVITELALIRNAQQDQGATLRKEIAAAKVEVTNLRMSPATVLAIVMFVLSLGGGYLTLRDSIAQLRQGQQMQELKTNELTNLVKDAIRQAPKGQP